LKQWAAGKAVAWGKEVRWMEVVGIVIEMDQSRARTVGLGRHPEMQGFDTETTSDGNLRIKVLNGEVGRVKDVIARQGLDVRGIEAYERAVSS
jgi:hypothetical protein